MRSASSWLSRVLWPVLAVSVPVLGCDGDGMMAGSDEADDDSAESRDCTDELRAEEYVLGLRKVGSAFSVQFVEALPAPPSRGDNTWRVMVTDMAGAGMSDLAIAATPFMPDHQHGSTVRTEVTEGAIPGEYVLSPVNLFMPGLWEVTLEMTAPDGTEDEVMFPFCVDP